MPAPPPIATIDVAPAVIADVMFVLNTIGRIIGSAECDGAIRLKLEAPEGISGHCVMLGERKDGSITYRLSPVVTQ